MMHFPPVAMTPARQFAITELTAAHHQQITQALGVVKDGCTQTVFIALPTTVDNRTSLTGYLRFRDGQFQVRTDYGTLLCQDTGLDISPLAKHATMAEESHLLCRERIDLFSTDVRFHITEPLRNRGMDGVERYTLYRYLHHFRGGKTSHDVAATSIAMGIQSGGLAVFGSEEKLAEEMQQRFGHSRARLVEMIEAVWNSAFWTGDSMSEESVMVTPLMPFAISPLSSLQVAQTSEGFAVLVVSVPAERVLTAAGVEQYHYYWRRHLDPERHLFVQHPNAYEAEVTSTHALVPREFLVKIYTENRTIEGLAMEHGVLPP